jgi:hypothetical protein
MLAGRNFSRTLVLRATLSEIEIIFKIRGMQLLICVVMNVQLYAIRGMDLRRNLISIKLLYNTSKLMSLAIGMIYALVLKGYTRSESSFYNRVILKHI